MQFTKTEIEGAWLITPRVIGDNRGYFFESFRAEEFAEHIGPITFVQENQSLSSRGVIRGLHFQKGKAAQGKLISVAFGAVRDVIVDLREESPTFGRWQSFDLSDENHHQLYIPRGCAHGFATLSDTAVIQYKCDNYYSPEAEAGLMWSDATLGIDWGIEPESATISAKDQRWPSWQECYKF
jgi:dTDP-4-dehydrorhamnose 3,5-epimerase